jgi:uncharacterized protein (DUF1800 family)
MLDLKAAAIATDRFGFGAKPGELAMVAADPRGWLHQQLGPGTARPGPVNSPAHLARFLKLRQERKTDPEAAKQFDAEFRDRFKADAAARTLAAAASADPFRERLVQFWSNHFTVSVQRPVVLPVARDFEDEAIRPHVTGRFRVMLRAVAQHPAMLLYLDNAVSVGPNSPVGRNKDKGLNENLAREMLELHTVGVDGGYTQQDVTAFAKILTGWSVARDGDPDPGSFRYRPNIHEPGEKIFLGRTWREAGMDEGLAAMDDLAGRPQTARHIATQLARHFVDDDPPGSAVGRLEKTFQTTGGDLGAVSATLIGLPEIWDRPLAKMKTPNDLVISSCRVFAVSDPAIGDELAKGLRLMGQVPFAAASPAGWPDTAAAWIAPESMMIRVQWALAAGQHLGATVDARAVAAGSIAPVASDRTLSHIGNAPSPMEAVALLIASPEFQRR